MHQTEHGFDRIQLRTKMAEKDVLEIVRAKAGVLLGKRKRYSYLLFYSPPDSAAKIAVYSTSNNGAETLISVWETDYDLPNGVRVPNLSLIKYARKQLHTFLVKRACKPTEKKERTVANQVHMRIVVIDNRRVVYTHEVGLVDGALTFDRSLIWDSHHNTLLFIASIISRNADLVKGKVGIEVRLFEPDGQKIIMYHKFNYRELVKKVEAA